MRPRTLCPKCKGKEDHCGMCEGKGYVTPDIASAWFALHPEASRAITDEAPIEGEEAEKEAS